jgi:hypothetical protein
MKLAASWDGGARGAGDGLVASRWPGGAPAWRASSWPCDRAASFSASDRSCGVALVRLRRPLSRLLRSRTTCSCGHREGDGAHHAGSHPSMCTGHRGSSHPLGGLAAGPLGRHPLRLRVSIFFRRQVCLAACCGRCSRRRRPAGLPELREIRYSASEVSREGPTLGRKVTTSSSVNLRQCVASLRPVASSASSSLPAGCAVNIV